MRVISGEARGRKLNTLEGMDVRPTADRVKEGLFNIIQFDVEGCRFLDLFAGSGQIGIEALSRGAEFVVLNDSNKETQPVIKENLAVTAMHHKARVFSMDAKTYLTSTKGHFNIAFLDPPYHQDILPEILPYVVPKMTANGIIICEHEADEEVPEEAGAYRMKKQYKYGKIRLTVYTVPESED